MANWLENAWNAIKLPFEISGKVINYIFGGEANEQRERIVKGLTGETSAEAQRDANERNLEFQNYWNNVAIQREDTAHQREVADLQAAGLNPWLSVSGTGAQTSALSTATVQPEDGSKILATSSAAAILALTKIISKLT